MAASDSYAVTLTAKCGAEISFSRVACVDLNGDFRNVFNMYNPDGIVLGKIQVGSTPKRAVACCVVFRYVALPNYHCLWFPVSVSVPSMVSMRPLCTQDLL